MIETTSYAEASVSFVKNPETLLTIGEALDILSVVENPDLYVAKPVVENALRVGSIEPTLIKESTQRLSPIQTASSNEAVHKQEARMMAPSDGGDNSNDGWNDGPHPEDEFQGQSALKRKSMIYWPREWRDKDPCQLGWFIGAEELKEFESKETATTQDAEMKKAAMVGQGRLIYWPLEWARHDPLLLGWLVDSSKLFNSVHNEPSNPHWNLGKGHDKQLTASQSTNRWIHGEETLAQRFRRAGISCAIRSSAVATPADSRINIAGLDESSYEMVPKTCKRWRRKRKLFEQKAKLFLERRLPLPTGNSYYEILEDLPPNEDVERDVITVASMSKKWKKKRNLFRVKAQTCLDATNGGLCISNSFSVLSGLLSESSDDDAS